jgi:two-component system, OmpR family, sensor histidine kinase TctE
LKIFRREQRSLFGEILDWMLAPLLLLWPASLVLTWLVAQGIANKPFDRALEYDVHALTQLVHVSPSGRVLLNLPNPAKDILRADEVDQVYFQVLGPRGELLGGDKDFPKPQAQDFDGRSEMRLRDDDIRGLDIRVAYAWNRVEGQLILVQVGETLEKRSTLAGEIIKGVMLPQFVILPLAVLLVWFGLIRGIKPLSELENKIRARKADDLSPIVDTGVPQEVAPLVASVNDLLTRLKDSLSTQKRFLADAAHQLKTPLAGLRMQADLALKQGASEAELKRSLQQIGRASIAATHTVNQLLSLARAENSGRGLVRQPVNLAEVVREVVQEAVSRALDRGIDLGYDGLSPSELESTGAIVMGNPVLIKEMVRNLVDNAINYTPSTIENTGEVTARVLGGLAAGALVVQVEDNGPGIAGNEKELIFQPFYRTLGSNVDGSGLGLAIVQEIANQHGCIVTIEESRPGKQPPGSIFSVKFLFGQ